MSEPSGYHPVVVEYNGHTTYYPTGSEFITDSNDINPTLYIKHDGKLVGMHQEWDSVHINDPE